MSSDMQQVESAEEKDCVSTALSSHVNTSCPAELMETERLHKLMGGAPDGLDQTNRSHIA